MRYYPLFLDLMGCPVSVVGGGKVAERKVTALLDAGADITLISPTVTSRLSAWVDQGKITLIARSYRRGDIKKARFVFAATNQSRVNEAVVHEAKGKGIWVNRADDGGDGNFINPACFIQGDLTVAVSTGGTAPRLSKTIRTAIQVSLLKGNAEI